MKAIDDALRQIVGLPLSLSRRGTTMRIFHFGAITSEGTRAYGEFALHLQCPWRIEGPEGLVTGSRDVFEPPDSRVSSADPDWNYDSGNLQDVLVAKWLGTTPGKVGFARSAVVPPLIVEAVSSDRFLGLKIALSGGHRLSVFPDGTAGEAWRFFRPCVPEEPLVIDGGSVL
ncbi:MAG TPA: hypothetical protein VG736_05205 [Vicinamibacterales bacterium]|nr:hypothetical protein [Vicinamibacterales bacterium]